MAVERQISRGNDSIPREIFEVRFEYSRIANAFVNGAEFRNIERCVVKVYGSCLEGKFDASFK